MGSWPEGTGQDSPYISFWCVVVCVCVFARSCGHTWHGEMEKELLLLSYQRLASLTLGKLIFVGVRCSSFNCFTSLISSALTTNSGCSSPLFLMPSLFLSSSHAVRPWGCQRRNKVTGWWARHPMSDHMDWCCARHRSGWLAQQGFSHNTGTYCRPGFSFFFSNFLRTSPPPWPPPHLRLFLSLQSAGCFVPPSVCLRVLPIFAFANTCLLFLPTLCGGWSCMSAVNPFFIPCHNCLSQMVGFPAVRRIMS